MKTVYLVRHGHVDNPQGIFYDGAFPLSEIGAKQMLRIAEDLRRDGVQPKRILSSPYLRTRESSQVLSSVLGPEVEYDDRLVEWQVGDWFGKDLNAFRSYVGYDQSPFRPHTTGIENFDSMADRVSIVIRDLVDGLQDGESALVVGHREPSVSGILRLRNAPDWTEVPLLDLPRGAAWRLDFDTNGTLVEARKAYDYSRPDDPKSLR
ncbi:MAG: phosphoglycerate mutase family protein [Candidatus Uhrbacteria bacterium]|nr:phosphoglycerate mutase family protein [Candidatus Uhrbacteria bacterium]